MVYYNVYKVLINIPMYKVLSLQYYNLLALY